VIGVSQFPPALDEVLRESKLCLKLEETPHA
jgi:hypothetical protein